MSEIGPVHVELSTDTGALQQSIADLSALVASVDAPNGLVELVDCELARLIDDGLPLAHDIGDLLIREAVDPPTGRTTKLHICQIDPADGYLVLFAALAGNAKRRFALSHGWPVLSVARDSATLAEARGDGSAPGGGAA